MAANGFTKDLLASGFLNFGRRIGIYFKPKIKNIEIRLGMLKWEC